MPIPDQQIFMEYAEQARHWYTGGMRMFHLYIFKYDFFKHDLTPLVLPFAFETRYNTYMAVNLHYLHPEIRVSVLESIDFLKLIHPETKEVVIDYKLLQQLFEDVSICLRRYKANGVSLLRHVPLEDFISKHWQSPGAMEPGFRQEMYNRSLNALHMKLQDRKKGII